MKTRSRKCKLELQLPHLTIWLMTVQFILTFNVNQTFAQDTTSVYFANSEPATADTTRKLFGGNITNFGYGGPAIKFSRFNNQFAFMTGGRGAITINNRYTIGGGGYGIANSINLPGPEPDTNRIFKMGYGGLELGYIFFSGKKVIIGGTLLVAAGAAFWQNKPKSNGEKLFDDDFSIFPVLEPSLYTEIALNRIMRLHAGISYRYVHHAHLDYVSDQNIRDFSFYVGLLFSK
jgi:hypothetical protein